MRIDSQLLIADGDEDRSYTSDQVIAILDSKRTTIPATYLTDSTSPTVYYTALKSDLTTLTARTTSGVTLVETGHYSYTQTCTGVSTFLALWDEGDANVYTPEWIVVP